MKVESRKNTKKLFPLPPLLRLSLLAYFWVALEGGRAGKRRSERAAIDSPARLQARPPVPSSSVLLFSFPSPAPSSLKPKPQRGKEAGRPEEKKGEQEKDAEEEEEEEEEGVHMYEQHLLDRPN